MGHSRGYVSLAHGLKTCLLQRRQEAGTDGAPGADPPKALEHCTADTPFQHLRDEGLALSTPQGSYSLLKDARTGSLAVRCSYAHVTVARTQTD